MAKKQTAESDESRLKQKIAQKLANHSKPEGDGAMRSLRRAVALRRKHASGNKPAEAAAPAAG